MPGECGDGRVEEDESSEAKDFGGEGDEPEPPSEDLLCEGEFDSLELGGEGGGINDGGDGEEDDESEVPGVEGGLDFDDGGDVIDSDEGGVDKLDSDEGGEELDTGEGGEEVEF